MLDNKYIPVEIYAEERRIPPEYVIKKIRKGYLVGRIYHNQWYLDLELSPKFQQRRMQEREEHDEQLDDGLFGFLCGIGQQTAAFVGVVAIGALFCLLNPSISFF